MASLMELDFRFKHLSAEYAQFILDALTAYPEGNVVEVKHLYDSNQLGTTVLSFSCPEDVAVVLRLKYQPNITKRPDKDDFKDYSKKYQYFKYLNKSEVYIKNDYKKMNQFFYDDYYDNK